MIDTLLFDLDNTLLDFSKAERIALTRTLNGMGYEADDHLLTRYSELNAAQWRLLEQGKLTREEVKVRRYALLFEEFNILESAAEATAIYEKLLEEGYYYMDGAEELLEALYQKYRLYMVTNGTIAVQKSRIQNSGMKKYFKDIFISEEVGYDKPSREYFDKCFSYIPDFDRSRALIVGDSLTSDILGGKNAGIRTVWFNPNQTSNTSGIRTVWFNPNQTSNTSGIQPDWEISQWKELLTLLDAMRRCE